MLNFGLSRLLVFEPLGSHDTYVRHKFTRHKGRVNSWRRRSDYFAALHHLAKFAHSRKPAYARPPFCGGSNPLPRVRIHIIKHNKKHARWA